MGDHSRLVRERDEAIRRCEQWNESSGSGTGTGSRDTPLGADSMLEAAERDRLAAALDRLVSGAG